MLHASLIHLSLGGLLLGTAEAPAETLAPDTGRALAPASPTAVPAALEAETEAEPTPEPEPEAEPTPQVAPAPVDHDALRCDEEPPQIWRGFRIESKDAQHSLAFGFLGQLEARVRDTGTDGPDGGFSVRLARPTMVAQLWGGRVAMRFMPEFAGLSAEVLDATVSVRAHQAFVVQVGQFRPWLSRGYRIGLPVQGLPGRGDIVDRFRIDRDVGLTVRGRPWGGKFEYYLGVLNGSGRNRTTMAPSPLLTARMVYAPLGEVPYTQTPYVRAVGPGSPHRHDAPTNDLAVAIGGSAYTVANRETVTIATGADVRTDPRRRWGASGDLVVSRRRVFTMAEGFYEHREDQAALGVPALEAWGVYGQVGLLAWNPFLDVTFRAGLLDENGFRTAPVEPGLNVYFMGNHGKLQLSYRCDGAVGENEARCRSHVGTLQAQLLF